MWCGTLEVPFVSLHSLLQSENGIFIIEEPENHLHPRYLGVLIETLFTYCDQLNVQVFMATHSYDLIQGALEFPETEAEKKMLLLSKMTSDGKSIEKFDYTTDEGLKVINELSLDLRGIWYMPEKKGSRNFWKTLFHSVYRTPIHKCCTD